MPIDLLELPMPVVLRLESPISDEELMRFSERNKPFKVERNKEGELVIMTPVGGIGSTHEAYVAYQLLDWNESVQRGVAFISNAGFNLPDGSCLSPDASWLALNRWNALTHEQQVGYPPLCPDFLIELRSQSDARRALEAKMQLWMENGAKLAWLVDPIDGRVTIYRSGNAPETLDHPEVVKAGAPVEGFELRCTRLWAAL
jgi:Uma2 family endonuclease